MCVCMYIYASERTAIIFLYRINVFNFTTVRERAFCAVRTGVLILCFFNPAALHNLVNRTNLVDNFFKICSLLFSSCFGQSMCPSSGENNVPVRNLVFITPYTSRWLSSMQGGIIPPCIPDSHLYRVTNTRCRIGTVFSPDDGHIVCPKHVEKSNK